MVVKPQCMVVKAQYIYGSHTFQLKESQTQLENQQKIKAIHIIQQTCLLTHCFVLDYVLQGMA